VATFSVGVLPLPKDALEADLDAVRCSAVIARVLRPRHVAVPPSTRSARGTAGKLDGGVSHDVRHVAEIVDAADAVVPKRERSERRLDVVVPKAP
jgi:hypothetical protein